MRSNRLPLPVPCLAVPIVLPTSAGKSQPGGIETLPQDNLRYFCVDYP
jgi:hypothetical protein